MNIIGSLNVDPNDNFLKDNKEPLNCEEKTKDGVTS